jgi:hypothetical protein
MCGQPSPGEVVHEFHIPGRQTPAPQKSKPSAGFIVAMVIVRLVALGAIINAMRHDREFACGRRPLIKVKRSRSPSPMVKGC